MSVEPLMLIIKTNPEQDRKEERMDFNRKLYRSNRDKMLCGVCGGIGEYLNIDPTLVRLLWAIFACTGMGLLAYFLAAVIIPADPQY